MNIYKAYTYIIKHIPSGKVYYGVRWANILKQRTPEEDLWNSYFTSSKAVKDLIEKDGINSFYYQVRRKFDTALEARIWEGKVLQRMKASSNPLWLNETDNKAIKFKEHPKGTKGKIPFVDGEKTIWMDKEAGMLLGLIPGYDNATRQKMSIAAKKRGSNRTGKSHSVEGKKNISDALKGKMSGAKNPFYGKSHSDETKLKLSKNASEKLECPHCHKVGGKHAMKRWHFDNCKITSPS